MRHDSGDTSQPVQSLLVLSVAYCRPLACAHVIVSLNSSDMPMPSADAHRDEAIERSHQTVDYMYAVVSDELYAQTFSQVLRKQLRN